MSDTGSNRRYYTQVARRAAYNAMGESPASIALHMKQHPDGEGIVLGDETRLRQIVTNLARCLHIVLPGYTKLTLLISNAATPANSHQAVVNCSFRPDY
jgi:hypothetical protein